MWEISNWLMGEIEENFPTLAETIKGENLERDSRYIPKEKRYNILKKQRWRCNQCNCVLKYDCNSTWEGEVAHIDHIHPYSKRETYPNGASSINEMSNLQALCPKCNLSKGKKENQ